MKLHPWFLVDANGRKKKALLSVKEYNALLECVQDVVDARLVDEVKGEPMVAWEKLKEKENKRRGLKG